AATTASSMCSSRANFCTARHPVSECSMSASVWSSKNSSCSSASRKSLPQRRRSTPNQPCLRNSPLPYPGTLTRSAQVLATMPSSQCRFAISPSHAAQQSSVDASGCALRISARFMPMRTPRSSRICQCGRPPPCAWSAITSSLHAAMMRMRVSQSVQLVATLSFKTELRCRVLSRCCSTNMRARPLVIGSWNQRQRRTNSFTARSMRATTLMRIRGQGNNCARRSAALARGSSCQFQRHALVALALGTDPHYPQAADLGDVRDVRAATGLQVDARDLEQPHAPFAARRRHRHGLDELGMCVELRIGDPARARVDGALYQIVQLAGDLIGDETAHIDVEIEMRLVFADAPAGHRCLHHRAQQMQRGMQPHQTMAALPVELRFDGAPDGGRGAGLEHMEHAIRGCAFARIEYSPGPEAPGIAGLAAAERIEHG